MLSVATPGGTLSYYAVSVISVVVTRSSHYRCSLNVSAISLSADRLSSSSSSILARCCSLCVFVSVTPLLLIRVSGASLYVVMVRPSCCSNSNSRLHYKGTSRQQAIFTAAGRIVTPNAI